jgi:uncharacterized NAD(P)/FAD-binding protein YdhS
MLAYTQTNNVANIAIIGGGFCGIMTAINLLQNDDLPLHIHIINKGCALAKGIAYDPNNPTLLLNVPNGRMSAFADQPEHYLNWLMREKKLDSDSKAKLSAAFSPRQVYGEYLACLWNEWRNKPGNKKITVYEDYADDITEDGPLLHISLREHPVLTVDTVVLATGNLLPRLPTGISPAFTESKLYFADPWKKDCIQNINNGGDILIIGNSLTMVDTVIGLTAEGFKGVIHSISPHGYRLKHSHDAREPHTGGNFSDINPEEHSLLDLVRSFNRHRKIAARYNQSVYPIVDSIRPKAQMLWQAFTPQEKQQFIRYINAFWGSLRHRLPGQMYDAIESARASGRLVTNKGHITSVKENGDSVEVTFMDNGEFKHLTVQRIINCTGPETDIKRPGNKLLNNLAAKGMVSPGPCGIGIQAQAASCIIPATCRDDEKQPYQPNLFVAGSNLKGMLWESTAVPELRGHAKTIAQQIIEGVYARQGQAVIPV